MGSKGHWAVSLDMEIHVTISPSHVHLQGGLCIVRKQEYKAYRPWKTLEDGEGREGEGREWEGRVGEEGKEAESEDSGIHSPTFQLGHLQQATCPFSLIAPAVTWTTETACPPAGRPMERVRELCLIHLPSPVLQVEPRNTETFWALLKLELHSTPQPGLGFGLRVYVA